MDKDLRSYVMVLENWIDKQICNQTIFELQNANWKQHTFYDVKNKKSLTQSDNRELDVTYEDGLSTKSYIMQRIWDAFQSYIINLNFSWFGGWQGFTDVRFNMYKETRLMAEHCDHIHSMFDGERKGIPTMTALGMLNENFTGGELVMWGNEVITMPAGSIVIFPSCFLYPHRVEPVTEGTRYSFVSWAW